MQITMNKYPAWKVRSCTLRYDLRQTLEMFAWPHTAEQQVQLSQHRV